MKSRVLVLAILLTLTTFSPTLPAQQVIPACGDPSGCSAEKGTSPGFCGAPEQSGMTPSVNDSSIGVVYGPDGYTDLSMTYGATGTFTNVQYSVNIQDSQGTPLYIDRGTYTLVPDIANNYHATVPVPLGGSVNWEITGTSASGGFTVIAGMSASSFGCSGD